MRDPAPLEGFIPGVRMKGGVRPNPDGLGFIAIVHTWDNVDCQGEPQEWRSSQVFPTENDAMSYYKASIRPGLEKLMAGLPQQNAGVKTFHRRLE